MRICYYALKPLQVGDDVREPGDLVPEALQWNHVKAAVDFGEIAPVLVATLPEEQQVMLLEWEDAYLKPQGEPVADKKVRRKEKVTV